MINSAASPIVLVIGGTFNFFVCVWQAVESYSFIHNSKKPLNKLVSVIRNNISYEPESKLFVERIFQPFLEIFGKHSKGS